MTGNIHANPHVCPICGSWVEHRPETDDWNGFFAECTHCGLYADEIPWRQACQNPAYFRIGVIPMYRFWRVVKGQISDEVERRVFAANLGGWNHSNNQLIVAFGLQELSR